MRHFGIKHTFKDMAKHWKLLCYFICRSNKNYDIIFWSQFSLRQLESYFHRLTEVD